MESMLGAGDERAGVRGSRLIRGVLCGCWRIGRWRKGGVGVGVDGLVLELGWEFQDLSWAFAIGKILHDQVVVESRRTTSLSVLTLSASRRQPCVFGGLEHACEDARKMWERQQCLTASHAG